MINAITSINAETIALENPEDDEELKETLRKNWFKLIGNCAYICRPRTPFTEEWYNLVIKCLDKNLEKLKISPAKNPRERFEEGGYPIRWAQLHGEIFHKLVFKYNSHVNNSLPRFINTDYL